MPKTKFQSVVFTMRTVFFMVYCMTVFTITDKLGELKYSTFLTALKEMWIEYVIVFVLIFFIISGLARKLALKVFDSETDKPILNILAVQCFTVCLIVPTITLIAVFIHNGATAEWFVQWITLAVKCFPTALCLQVFWVGPLSRFIFRKIFVK